MKEKVFIESYKGINIYFDPVKEVFLAIIKEDYYVKDNGPYVINEDGNSEFAEVKSVIDDFIKDIDPFFVYKLDRFNGKLYGPIEIVAIRKDGAFIQRTKNGEIIGINKFDEEQYILSTSNYEPIKNKIEKISDRIKIPQKAVERLNSSKNKYIKELEKLPNLLTIKKQFIH